MPLAPRRPVSGKRTPLINPKVAQEMKHNLQELAKKTGAAQAFERRMPLSPREMAELEMRERMYGMQELDHKIADRLPAAEAAAENRRLVKLRYDVRKNHPLMIKDIEKILSSSRVVRPELIKNVSADILASLLNHNHAKVIKQKLANKELFKRIVIESAASVSQTIARDRRYYLIAKSSPYQLYSMVEEATSETLVNHKIVPEE